MAPPLGMANPSVIGVNSILVPTDFSEASEKAVEYAADLATTFDAKVSMIYVDDLNYSEIGMFGIVDADRLRQETKARASDKLERLIGQYIPEASRGETLVVEGKPGLEIVEYAAKAEVDLLVVSTHGHTGLSHMLLGSTAEYVVRRAPCPVLSVHDRDSA